MARLLEIRSEDRRDAMIGCLTLFGVMTGHSILETARDALFLAGVPARQLPWAYISIAGLALVATWLNRFALQRVSRRRALASTLAVGGILTVGFATILSKTEAALFGLYVWTGLLATVLVVQFWLLAAEVFDVGQAKRVFGFVAAGGLIGAVAGSATAGVLLLWMAPASLVGVAGAAFAASAALPLGFARPRDTEGPPRRRPQRGAALRVLREEPYLRRVFWTIMLSTIVFTGVDYIFKTMVAIDVAPDQLGPFFARFYVVMNGAAFVVQLLLAPRLLSLLGVHGSLLLLPSVLIAGALGFALTLGLGAVLAVRGAEGALRHSLHRTGTEILYLPLSSEVRDRFKAAAEALGQRGGQAVASVGILGAVALHARPAHVAVGLAGLTVLWVALLRSLRPHYLELFRRSLREGAVAGHVEVSDLDLQSLEVLIGALSSENDNEVIGALDLLAAHGRANLVPALILHHPSSEVVLHAFALFAGSDRADVRRLTARLLRHDNPSIRAAALRVHSEREPDRELLAQMLEDPADVVRAMAMVHTIRAAFVDEWSGGDRLRGIIDGDSRTLRLALAQAGRDLPKGRYAWALVRLAGVREVGLATEVARSMAAAPDPEFLPTLVRMLADRDCRDAARTAILALGDDALAQLELALGDETLPRRVRRHLPRTISRFVGGRAARVLVDRLAVETDEVVVMKILRGLGRMREIAPSIRIERPTLDRLARTTLERAVTLLRWRVALEGTSGADLPSAVVDLLLALLSDMEESAIQRVFGLLQILDPSEEFRLMHVRLRGVDRRAHASSRELLSNVVGEPTRSTLLALIDDTADKERLARASSALDPAAASTRLVPSREHCLTEMAGDGHEAIRSVANYRLSELGLGGATPSPGPLFGGGDGPLAELTPETRAPIALGGAHGAK